MAKVEHFEIPADDMDRARAFYSDVFGFQYEPWGEDMGMLQSPEEGGIGGDLHQRGEVQHPTIVITVDDIDATLDAVVANGGAQLGEIQSMGESARYVYVTDSEGNTIGLYDDQASAG